VTQVYQFKSIKYFNIFQHQRFTFGQLFEYTTLSCK